MIRLGYPALWTALALAVASIVWSLRATTSTRANGGGARLLYGASALATFTGLVALAQALLTHDFRYRYVAWYTSALLDTQPALTALWAGQAGTLLVFAACTAIVGVVATLAHRRSALSPVATGTIAMVSVIVLAALCFGPSPFRRLPNPPPEGRGLHPQLLHLGMLVQPPLVLFGLAALGVPFAFTVAQVARATVIRETAGDARAAFDASADGEWRSIAQRWLLIAWLALTAGLLAGLWWAQQQLGWFGYFFTWEPYASAPMLPWLAVTAILTVRVSGADRAASGWWLAAFITFAFLLGLFGLMAARGGIAESIRAVQGAPSVFLLVLTSLGLGLTAALGVAAVRRGGAGGSPRVSMGGMLTLVGVLVAATGLAASHWRRDLSAGVDIGQAIDVRDAFGRPWRFTSQGLSQYEDPAYAVLGVALAATQNGTRAGLLTSQQRQYFDAQSNPMYEPTTRVGSLAQLTQTVTVGFLGAIDRTSAAVRISFVPLVNAVWFGAMLTLLGMTLAAWPSRENAVPIDLPATVATTGRCPSCDADVSATSGRYCPQCGAALASPSASR